MSKGYKLNLSPEEIARRTARLLAGSAKMTPEARARGAAKNKIRFSTPEYRAQAAQKTREAWARRKAANGISTPAKPSAPPPMPEPEIKEQPGTAEPAAIIQMPGTNGNGAHPPAEGAEENGGGRIYWRPLEIDALAIRTALLLRKQGLAHIPHKSDRVGSMILLDIVRAAQLEVLPRERRRLDFSGRNALSPQFWERLEKEVAKGQPDEPPAVPASAKAAAPEEKKPDDSPAPTPTAAPGLSLEQIPLARLVQYTTERLLAEIAGLTTCNDMLINDVAALQQENKKIYGELAEIRNLAPGLTPKKKPIVAILGCYKHQFDNIADNARSLGLDIELRHFDEDQNPRVFAADYAIAMRFMRHAWDEKARAACGPRYRFLGNGGISAVVNQLSAWFGK